MSEKIFCPGCNQLLEHVRGFLPTHVKDLQRGQLVTGSKICDYSNKKIITECREVEYKHTCDVCGMTTELKLTEDYPGGFSEGIKPFVEMNCIGCSTDHDGYYCSNNGCGLEVEERLAEFWRVTQDDHGHLPVLEDDSKTWPRYRDFDSLADAEAFIATLPSPVSGADYEVNEMDSGWYDTRGDSECRAAVLDPKGMLLAGGGSGHQGAFKPKFEHKVLVTDGHLIREEPEPGEVVEPDAERSNVVLICDCCHLRRDELPYQYEPAGVTYCQECEDAGCDFIECSVRANQRAGRQHA